MDTKAKDGAAATGLNWRNKPRRTFSAEQRLAMVRECEAPGVSVAEVAQRNRINTNLLFKWRRLY
jgi:transposase